MLASSFLSPFCLPLRFAEETVGAGHCGAMPVSSSTARRPSALSERE